MNLVITRAIAAAIALFLAGGCALADEPRLERRMNNPALACSHSDTFALALHGGAFWGNLPDDNRQTFLRAMLEKGKNWLEHGALAFDVVEELAAQMEDSGRFNAGRGAIANEAGFVEMDAAIMDGRGSRAGAVAAVRQLKNPVRAARMVMTRTRHVLLSGPNADRLIAGFGAEPAEPGYFLSNKTTGEQDAEFDEEGTIGAVALDRCGNLAAATSTGGYDAKIPGRIGDSPIPGAGLYAENGVATISSTGHGESFIRTMLAHEIAMRMKLGNQTISQAAETAIHETLARHGGEGGVIAIDSRGNIAFAFNTDGMVRGKVSNRQPASVAAGD